MPFSTGVILPGDVTYVPLRPRRYAWDRYDNLVLWDPLEYLSAIRCGGRFLLPPGLPKILRPSGGEISLVF